MTASRGSWLTEATILFFCWSFLSLLVRIWVKITRRDKWGLDDSSITGGFVSTISPAMGTGLTVSQAICVLHIGFIFWAISDGYGRPLDSPELKIHLVGKVKPLKTIQSTELHCEAFAGSIIQHDDFSEGGARE